MTRPRHMTRARRRLAAHCPAPHRPAAHGLAAQGLTDLEAL